MTSRTKTTALLALIVLNVLLVLSFIGRVAPSSANSAMAQGTRRPGEYVMIPGLVTGGTSGVVYIVDTTNGLLTATTYDTSAVPPHLESLAKTDLASIFAKGMQGNANPPNNNTGRGNRGR